MNWRHSSSNRPQKFRVQNLPEKISPRLFGTKTASSSLIIFQRNKLSTGSITNFCWCNWRIFWSKNAAGISQSWSCSCTIMPRRTGHLQTRRNWHTFPSSFLITHPSLRIWSRRTTTSCLDWKAIEWSPFFVRRGGHCCRETLVGRKKFWIFLSVLQKLEKRSRKCIEIRGEYVE